jgi:hypothetical protein
MSTYKADRIPIDGTRVQMIDCSPLKLAVGQAPKIHYIKLNSVHATASLNRLYNSCALFIFVKCTHRTLFKNPLNIFSRDAAPDLADFIMCRPYSYKIVSKIQLELQDDLRA